MNLPKVSCVCPTYNRLEQIEEAVQSFHMQDYDGEKELIILNDCKVQKIYYDHPEVTVINHPKRFSTLGKKRNYLNTLATGKYICPWDDDDICMPWRISASIEKIGDKLFMKPSYFYWLDEKDNLKRKNYGAHGMCIYSKELLEVVNYPEKHRDEDGNFEKELIQRGIRYTVEIRNFYIYRFCNWRHATHVGKFKETLDEVEKKIEPKWKRDWIKVNKIIEKKENRARKKGRNR